MERTPTAGQLLDVWEQGRFQTTARRALLLLALAAPAVPSEKLACYSVGRRDHELLGLREKIFGPRLTGTAQCPSCGQEVEIDFSIRDIRTQGMSDAEQMHFVKIDGYDLQFHLPTCGDLVQFEANGVSGGNSHTLLECCVAETRHNGAAVAASSLPDETVAILSQRMAELDPQGDIQLALSCPTCACHWESPLDMASYLWNEIESWAGRMLREVHTLASAYGWREADILGMDPWRRQAYLELSRQ